MTTSSQIPYDPLLMKSKKLQTIDDQRNVLDEILNIELPNVFLMKKYLKSKAKVTVCTIYDLELYMSYIYKLRAKYAHFHGHKKAIAELLDVSVNRIGEWNRISLAIKAYSHCPSVREILADRTSSLSCMIKALKKEGWQASAGGTYSPNSKSRRKISLSPSPKKKKKNLQPPLIYSNINPLTELTRDSSNASFLLPL